MSPIERLRQKMAAEKLPSMLVTNLINVGYLSGFTGSNAVLFITPGIATLFTDSRYTLQASRECPGFQIDTVSIGPLEAAAAEINRLGLKRVGFEEEHLTVRQHSLLKSKLESARTVPTRWIVESLRGIKDESEIDLTRAACRLADEAFEHILSFIKPGMAERDVATEIDFFFRGRGAKEGFETIVASGYRAALPHAQPTEKKIAKGEMLKMDFGAVLEGYNSDITRVVAIGEPDKTLRSIYSVVLEAQLAGIAAVRSGAIARDVDAVARRVIAEAGYGDKFGHGLGHSLGRETHDGLRLSSKSDTVLEPGMIFTVEPGVYIEGWGGVRIEDDVLVTENGCEVLTHATKELIVIG